MVRGCVTQSAPKHEGSHRRGSDDGNGIPSTNLMKQKLNTRSSTETEIVGVDGFVPGVLWTRLFLEAQDYGFKENILFQDNKTAMLLEKNGKASSGKRTKHINTRYFFLLMIRYPRAE